ncbi:MAG: hypothetical protein HY326_04790 [Chloroflexi bacterium]|nr:hypothetical protein [Chloroflexota bacterium]
MDSTEIRYVESVVFPDLIRSHFATLIEIAAVPPEFSKSLLELLDDYQVTAGRSVRLIKEGVNYTDKIIDQPNETLLRFRFPTTEQLDKDANSADEATAALAKRLKRFEKRLDEAAMYGRTITVIYMQSESDKGKLVPAADILEVHLVYPIV